MTNETLQGHDEITRRRLDCRERYRGLLSSTDAENNLNLLYETPCPPIEVLGNLYVPRRGVRLHYTHIYAKIKTFWNGEDLINNYKAYLKTRLDKILQGDVSEGLKEIKVNEKNQSLRDNQGLGKFYVDRCLDLDSRFKLAINIPTALAELCSDMYKMPPQDEIEIENSSRGFNVQELTPEEWEVKKAELGLNPGRYTLEAEAKKKGFSGGLRRLLNCFERRKN